MDCRLQMHPIKLYQPVLQKVVVAEESAEVIVPDSFPDILRIVDSWGMACLKDKETQQDRLNLAGVVRAVTLYIPENGRGVRKLEVQIPFTSSVESPEIEADSGVVLHLVGCSIHTRIVNPRKISVSAQVKLQIQVYSPRELSITDGVEDAEAQGLQMLTKEITFTAVQALKDKYFTVSEELEMPATKPPISEIIKSEVFLSVADTKFIGNKQVLKGNAVIKTMYLSGDPDDGGERIFVVTHELPFSQVIELESEEEDIQGDVSLLLSGMEIYGVGGEDGSKALSVTLGITAQAVATVRRQETVIADLYSTLYDLTADSSPLVLSAIQGSEGHRQAVRESLEIGAPASSILDVTVVCDEAVSREEDGSFTCDANVSVLYVGEDRELYSVSRHLPVACPYEFPSGGTCLAQAAYPGEALASAGVGSIDVRFPVDFEITAMSREKLPGYHTVTLDEKPDSGDPRPSVTLRRAARGETLWSIAKSCCTTVEEISGANVLEGDALPEGALLLIPRHH